MKGLNKKSPLFLFFGDAIILVVSLWLSLLFRYWEIPSNNLFLSHLGPFSYLFLVWLLVYLISGLYDKSVLTFSKKLFFEVSNAQIVNTFIAIAFFYFIPMFTITPKTILFLNLVISFALILFWRIYVLKYIGIRRKIKAVFVGTGKEIEELSHVLSEDTESEVDVVSIFDTKKNDSDALFRSIVEDITYRNVSTVVVDFEDKVVAPILSSLYSFIFRGVKFVDIQDLYEDILEKVPLSLVKHEWFLENVFVSSGDFYGFFRRLFDIIFSLIIGCVFLIILPFIAIAIKIEDGGSVFFINKRVGKKNKEIKIYKFRSMSVREKEKITRVGNFIRKTRLDELPQFFNVLIGDLSFIGPRPEKPELAFTYESEIPFYNVRHLVKPGLSGWAQIYQDNPPKFGLNIEDTKTKLAYDLYYIKNRSLLLDLKIALRTIKTLLSRTGK
jgi:exopolysaccharide biosynthesis polyprenyl glycosylphosphotransferase